MKRLITVICSYCLLMGCRENNVTVLLDAADNSFNIDGKKVLVFTTDSMGNRLTNTATLTFKEFDQPLETQPSIFVDPSHRFQTIVGIGGALTDAAAETFSKLSPGKQKECLQAYYDSSKGIGYTFGRTNINSCDFSSDSY
ncbi:MAG: hypothetical protein ACXVBX_02115, partial [Flavisolibacter sp.]